MKLEYNEQELQELMRDFYLLTGIRIVLFDLDYHELLSYPENHCRFCSQMKSVPETRLLCNESDHTSFQQCQESGKLMIYHCYAGLIEAAAKIMEACTFYVILKDTIRVRRDNFIRNMDQYLMEHLAEELSAGTLAAEFGISKTKLYQVYQMNYGCGVAEHIRYLRIEKAKSLLAETMNAVSLISDMVGFTDYNYFCRVFKKQIGIPAKKYRLTYSSSILHQSSSGVPPEISDR